MLVLFIDPPSVIPMRHLTIHHALLGLLLLPLTMAAQRVRPPVPLPPGAARTIGQLQVVIDNAIEMELIRPTTTVRFNKRTDTKKGATGTSINQFIVTSNLPYGISVTSASAFLTSNNNRIPVSSIGLSIVKASNTGTLSPVKALSTLPQALNRRAPAAISQPYSFTYVINPVTAVNNAPTGIYLTNLLFTATQE